MAVRLYMILLVFSSCKSMKKFDDLSAETVVELRNNLIFTHPYQLEGRLPKYRPIPDYPCKKEGRVVVSIMVDRLGKVISATPGVKGSTTTESCLLAEAKKTAMNTKWQAVASAPEKQIGKIIYNFSLH